MAYFTVTTKTDILRHEKIVGKKEILREITTIAEIQDQRSNYEF